MTDNLERDRRWAKVLWEIKRGRMRFSESDSDWAEKLPVLLALRDNSKLKERFWGVRDGSQITDFTVLEITEAGEHLLREYPET